MCSSVQQVQPPLVTMAASHFSGRAARVSSCAVRHSLRLCFDCSYRRPVGRGNAILHFRSAIGQRDARSVRWLTR